MIVDTRRITDAQAVNMGRYDLLILELLWANPHRRAGRTVTRRYEFETFTTVFEVRDGSKG